MTTSSRPILDTEQDSLSGTLTWRMYYLTSLVSPQSYIAQSTAKTYHSGFWQALAPPKMAGSLGGLLEKGETNPAPLCQVNKSVGGKSCLLLSREMFKSIIVM